MRVVFGLVMASLAGCGFHVSAQGDAGDDARPIDAAQDHDSADIDAMLDASIDSTPDALEKACPDGAPGFRGQSLTDAHFAVNDHWFYFSGAADVKHFNAAETACEGIGSPSTKPVHLATPNSTEAPLVGAVQPFSYMWIGVYQLQNQATTKAGWVTVTGKTGADVYVNWADGEPSDTNGSENSQENYAQMYGGPDGHPDGTMNDTSGNDDLSYICECDGDAAVP